MVGPLHEVLRANRQMYTSPDGFGALVDNLVMFTFSGNCSGGDGQGESGRECWSVMFDVENVVAGRRITMHKPDFN